MLEECEKIHFELEVKEDGFPPISIESLNGMQISDGKFRVENTPFFAEGIAIGDVIQANRRSGLKGFWFDSVIEESKNISISIIFIEENLEERVYQKMKEFGCFCEYGEFGALRMLAVCVYASVDYAQVSNFLDELESQERLSYAELCLT